MYKIITTLYTATLLTLSLQAAPPNILFIGVDDLRPELGCYGAGHIQSPHMDALADSGLRFEGAYCQQAVCLPSRISLFTGMRPDSTRVRDLATHFRDTIPDAVTLIQHFRANGYHTIGMGKVLHDEQPAEWNEWFDSVKLPEVTEYHDPGLLADIMQRQEAAEKKGLKGEALRKMTKGPATENAAAPEKEYADAAMTDLAIQKLKENRDRPFFMTLGYKKPHLPFVAPAKYWALYDRSRLSLPDNYFFPQGAPQIALMTWGELRAYSDIPATGPVRDEKALELKHGYYASISFIDEQIGRLLQALKDEGLEDHTIVVLWGDHGWKLGEHAMWCKHTNFEIDARVPLLLRIPGQTQAGTHTRTPVELIDLFPSLCEAAGLPVPAQCEGQSLLPLVRHPEHLQERYAFSQFTRARKTGGDITGYSVKIPQGRYTEWINQESGKVIAREFYDHEKDRDENRNAIDELSPEEVQRYSQILTGNRNSL